MRGKTEAIPFKLRVTEVFRREGARVEASPSSRRLSGVRTRRHQEVAASSADGANTTTQTHFPVPVWKGNRRRLTTRESLSRGAGSEIILAPAQSFMILKQMLHQSAELDLMFQALADPTRRVMIERLGRGPTSVSELAKPLAMSLSAVLQHLQVLEASGLVRSEKVGRVRTCRIDPTALRTAEEWIARRRAMWARRLDRLGDYLTEQANKPR
jgi:DNA-binding transcriptional ArsR family regulator